MRDGLAGAKVESREPSAWRRQSLRTSAGPSMVLAATSRRPSGVGVRAVIATGETPRSAVNERSSAPSERRRARRAREVPPIPLKEPTTRADPVGSGTKRRSVKVPAMAGGT